MPSLTIQTGPAKGRTFVLTGQKQSIGREGDIQVLDTAASRKHAEIFPLGERLLIRDLDSMNGTCVNDMKIDKEVVLRQGDRIRIGSSLLLYAEGAEQPVEFVQDTAQPDSSTVEIRLGDMAAQVVSGDKAAAGAMTRLFTMYEVARVLGRETSLQGVADKLVELTMASVKPTYCYMFIRDDTGGNLVPKAWRDPHRKTRRQISRSIVMRAMQHRHSIL